MAHANSDNRSTVNQGNPASYQGNKGSNGQRNGTSNRGFASMDPQRQREIASQGGKAAHAAGTAHQFTSEEAREAGKRSHENNNRGNKSNSGTSTGVAAKTNANASVSSADTTNIDASNVRNDKSNDSAEHHTEGARQSQKYDAKNQKQDKEN